MAWPDSFSTDNGAMIAADGIHHPERWSWDGYLQNYAYVQPHTAESKEAFLAFQNDPAQRSGRQAELEQAAADNDFDFGNLIDAAITAAPIAMMGAGAFGDLSSLLGGSSGGGITAESIQAGMLGGENAAGAMYGSQAGALTGTVPGWENAAPPTSSGTINIADAPWGVNQGAGSLPYSDPIEGLIDLTNKGMTGEQAIQALGQINPAWTQSTIQFLLNNPSQIFSGLTSGTGLPPGSSTLASSALGGGGDTAGAAPTAESIAAGITGGENASGAMYSGTLPAALAAGGAAAAGAGGSGAAGAGSAAGAAASGLSGIPSWLLSAAGPVLGGRWSSPGRPRMR